MSGENGYATVAAPASFDVITVVPYTEEPEYRHYEVGSDDLPLFLDSMANSQHAERVILVEPAGGSGWGDRL